MAHNKNVEASFDTVLLHLWRRLVLNYWAKNYPFQLSNQHFSPGVGDTPNGEPYMDVAYWWGDSTQMEYLFQAAGISKNSIFKIWSKDKGRQQSIQKSIHMYFKGLLKRKKENRCRLSRDMLKGHHFFYEGIWKEYSFCGILHMKEQVWTTSLKNVSV